MTTTTFPNCYSYTLSLESWREVFGFHPLHFWQMYNVDIAPLDSTCDSIVYEKPWQMKDQLGRMQIREAIQLVTHTMAKHLGYWPAPTQVTETIDLTGHLYGGCAIFKLKWPRVKQLGRYIYNTMAQFTWGEDGGIEPYDVDGDEFAESGFIPAGSIDIDYWNAGEYILLNDAVPQNFNNTTGDIRDVWPFIIEPLEGIYETSTLLGLAFPAAQTLRKGLRMGLQVDAEELDITPIDEEEPGDFTPLGKVWLARRVLYTDDAVTFIYDSPCTCGVVADESEAAIAGSYVIQDAHTGYLTIQLPCTCRMPTKVQVHYITGADLSEWVETIARFSAAELGRVICGCETSNRELEKWQIDFADIPTDTNYTLSEEALGNPFGTRTGHIYAWNRVVNSQALRSVAFQ